MHLGCWLGHPHQMCVGCADGILCVLMEQLYVLMEQVFADGPCPCTLVLRSWVKHVLTGEAVLTSRPAPLPCCLHPLEELLPASHTTVLHPKSSLLLPMLRTKLCA